MQVKIVVKNKIASPFDKNVVLVCGNNDYEINFIFDDEWTAYPAKTARFVWNGQFVDVAFTGTVCNIPIINNALYVAIGVYAGDLHTTTPALINMKKSILCDNPIHIDPPEDVYNQILELIREGAIKGDPGEGVAEGGRAGQILAKKSNADYDTEWVDPSAGGASSWQEVQNKPFESVGSNLLVENGVLKVDTTDDAEEDNTRPITSAGAYTIVGNINTLLSLI